MEGGSINLTSPLDGAEEMEKEATYYEQVTKREFNILKDIYQCRAMTTDQIRREHFPTQKAAYNRVLSKMRSKNYIVSKTLNNSREGRKGISYHRITEAGLECLANNGLDVKGSVQNTYLKPAQLHYVLLSNDIQLELRKEGWEIWDSRKVKRMYNLDDRMNIQGLLINPTGKQYGFYVLDSTSREQTIGRIQAEIRDNYTQIKNFIVFAKGKESYQDFLKMALNERIRNINGETIKQKELYTGYDINVISMKVGMDLYGKLPTELSRLKALSKYYGFEIVSTKADNQENDFKRTFERQSFDTIIRYQGEEMYLADLIDTNLKTVREINTYNEHSFKLEGQRKVLVLSIMEDQRNLISGENHYVEHLVITTKDFENIMDKETI